MISVVGPAWLQQPPGPRRGAHGFTLVEVLMAAMVLAIGLLGALTAFSMATRVTGASTNDTILTLLAQEKLAEIQLLGTEAISASDRAGDFGPAYPGYRWRLSPQRPNELNVVRVDLVIIAPEAGGERETWFSTNVF